MNDNPFVVTKAEEFNHSYELLASLMQFKAGVAQVLLSNTNVIIEGSRGSGKSMYLRMLSLPVKSTYDGLSERNLVTKLPVHSPFLGVYAKLNPTLFGPHENERNRGFNEAFQQLFNIYCVECLITSILEVSEYESFKLTEGDESYLIQNISDVILPNAIVPGSVDELLKEVRRTRRLARVALNEDCISFDFRSQPDVLWQVSEVLSNTSIFREQRVHFLIDEYDSLSQHQQRIINVYLRKRDYPVTFKVACKKHCLTLEDLYNRPLNPSGDFHRIELDDNEFGISSSYSDYIIAIADKRLKRAGYSVSVQEFLSDTPRAPRAGVEIKYGGFKMIAMLSSGIVRTFLELCRDIFSLHLESRQTIWRARIEDQDKVVKQHATNKWSSMTRDHSTDTQLQHLIDQIATVFRLKADNSKETQIIRLEIVDYNRIPSYLHNLLTQALEYEALVQPNRERLQKNKMKASRGFLLHRLLCVHYRLRPTSRWDFEISTTQIEKLLHGDYADAEEVVKNPTKSTIQTHTHEKSPAQLSLETGCPILREECPTDTPTSGLGFLSCRLPKSGHIRDAIRLLKEAFAESNDEDTEYKLLTAEEYPAQGDIACKVCHAFANSDFVVVEMSLHSPSVAMELGLAIARRKATFILYNSDETSDVPPPFSSLEYFSYDISKESVTDLVNSKIIPQLKSGIPKHTIRLGPQDPPYFGHGDGVFIALPGDVYHQETVLPEISKWLEQAGLGPVIAEDEGQALQEVQKAAINIAKAKFCLIDTTSGATTRALYLGLAQGYRKIFANLIDENVDPNTTVFTNAKSKSEIRYSHTDVLKTKLASFFSKHGVKL